MRPLLLKGNPQPLAPKSTQSSLPGSRKRQAPAAKLLKGKGPPIINKVTPENTEESVESPQKKELSASAGGPSFVAVKTSHKGPKQGGLVGKVKNQFRELIRSRLAQNEQSRNQSKASTIKQSMKRSYNELHNNTSAD